jgi:uncharacterized protein (TIGR01777 family)
MIVLITGGTGLIGSRVAAMLGQKGHEVRLLSRSRPPYTWDPEHGQITDRALDGVDAVVHLAGENIAGRWTQEKKAAIVESRRRAAELLVQAVGKSGRRPVIVCASAIGFYGDRGSELLTEDAAPGKGFLAETTGLWEESLKKLGAAASRSVILRIGVVLDKHLGALPKMVQPVRMFAGAPLGSGRQYMSWIHIEDLARIICLAIDRTFESPGLKTDLSGVFNAVAPAPVSNREMTQSIARTIHRPAFLPAVPEFVLKTLLGDMSALVLESARVSSGKIESAGFSFRYTDINSALLDLLGQP